MKNGMIERALPQLEGENELSDLLKLYKENKDSEVLNRIIEICYPMVDFVVKSPKYSNYDRDALVSYASDGLLRAIENCDKTDVKYFKNEVYKNVFGCARNAFVETVELPGKFMQYFNSELKRIKDSKDYQDDDISVIEEAIDNLIDRNIISGVSRDYYLNRILLSNYMTERIDDKVADPQFIDDTSLDYNLYLKELRNILLSTIDDCCTDVQKESIKRYFGLDCQESEKKYLKTRAAYSYNVKQGLKNLKKYILNGKSSMVDLEYLENVSQDEKNGHITYDDNSSFFLEMSESMCYAKKKIRK